MDIIKILYDLEKEEREKHERKDGIIYVTDLVSCPLKPEFERKFPELKTLLEPALTLGNLVHLAIEKILQEKCNAQIEVEKEAKIGEYVIKGRIDAIVGNIGVEIKYSRTDNYIPYDHHITQVKIYNWLFNLDKTILFYITPDRLAQYEIVDRAGEKYILTLIEDRSIPRYDWECSRCPFAKICHMKKNSK